MKLELYKENATERLVCAKHNETMQRLMEKTGLGRVAILHKACEAYEAVLTHNEGDTSAAIPHAITTLRQAMRDDSSYAWTWHSNIAINGFYSDVLELIEEA